MLNSKRIFLHRPAKATSPSFGEFNLLWRTETCASLSSNTPSQRGMTVARRLPTRFTEVRHRGRHRGRKSTVGTRRGRAGRVLRREQSLDGELSRKPARRDLGNLRDPPAIGFLLGLNRERHKNDFGSNGMEETRRAGYGIRDAGCGMQKANDGAEEAELPRQWRAQTAAYAKAPACQRSLGTRRWEIPDRASRTSNRPRSRARARAGRTSRSPPRVFRPWPLRRTLPWMPLREQEDLRPRALRGETRLPRE